MTYRANLATTVGVQKRDVLEDVRRSYTIRSPYQVRGTVQAAYRRTYLAAVGVHLMRRGCSRNTVEILLREASADCCNPPLWITDVARIVSNLFDGGGRC